MVTPIRFPQCGFQDLSACVAELDDLLASDDIEVTDEQLQRLRELTREDLAAGLRAAVSEKRSAD